MMSLGCLGAMGFYVLAGHPLKLLAESRWNQLEVTNYAKYQIPKSVLYESEMNKIWMNLDNIKMENEKNLCNYTNFY